MARLILAVGMAVSPGCTGGDVGGEHELVIGAPRDGYGFGLDQDVAIYPVNANVYETLLRLTATHRVEPMLATRWERRPDSTGRLEESRTWRFHLRPGVRFHDGRPLTAEAVVWTMDRVARLGGGQLGVRVGSAVAVDDSTVDITTQYANGRLPLQLVHPNYSILAPGTEPGVETVGTGPYELREYIRESHVVVGRFDDYWGGPADIEQIRFRFLPDPNTRVLALRAGEVDAAYDVPRETTAELESTPGIRIERSLPGGYEALYVNLHGAPPWDLGADASIRRALAHAIDARAVVDQVWSENASMGQGIVPSALLGDQASEIHPLPHAPDRSRHLLDRAGWASGPDGIRVRNGRRLSLVMVVGFPNPEVHRPMPEIVQAQLRDVGIELRIEQVPDNAAYQARVSSGEGDLWAEAGGQNDANPCMLPELLFYGGEEGRRSNYSHLFAPGPDFDLIIERCRSGSVQDIRTLAAEAVRRLVEEEVVVIPLAETFRVWGVRQDIAGFVPHPSTLHQRWERVRRR